MGTEYDVDRLRCHTRSSQPIEPPNAGSPPSVRCTALALGFNVALGVIGGLTPLAAVWLVERTGDELAPAFLIMATAVISFLFILRMPETRRAPFAPAAA